MTTLPQKPDTAAVLRGLKDFQRDTVDYVFQRLYLDSTPTHRFLIADEVGLGKTLVARGLIARAVDHLWERLVVHNHSSIDVVYICSNNDIARQNIRRLNITGQDDIAFASRITLLPIRLGQLQGNPINFVSFTPGTSFNMGGNLGIAEERALLYWLLHGAWGFDRNSEGPRSVLQGTASPDTFRWWISTIKQNAIAPHIAAQFTAALHACEPEQRLRARFEELAQRFRSDYHQNSDHDRWKRNQLVGALRELLAEVCLDSLEPDLIILDEFQRFKELIERRDNNPVNRLAHRLFNYADAHTEARVVLLSATPYKMYTLAQEHEPGGDDHYQDFLRTLTFLQHQQHHQAEKLLTSYRHTLLRLNEGDQHQLEILRDTKTTLEHYLRQVMVRTERLSASPTRDGMLCEITGRARLEVRDLQAYLEFQRVAHTIGQPDTLEYWKSAPYLLNFMDTYQFKQDFKAAQAQPERAELLVSTLAHADAALLPWKDIASYRRVDPTNARLRGLLEETVDRGAWKLLWIPPAFPYYQLAGPFAEHQLQRFTKRLIFSSWQVVPKIVATLTSYEAERHMIQLHDPTAENTAEARTRRRGLLTFSRSEGRLNGMPVLAMLYPCHVLARKCDPLALAQKCTQRGSWPDIQTIFEQAHTIITKELEQILPKAGQSGPEDQNWYWAAPLLLDQHILPQKARDWFMRSDLAHIWTGVQEAPDDDRTQWDAHVQLARDVLQNRVRLGRPPDDLANILTLLALGGPAIVVLRALSRITSSTTPGSMSMPCEHSTVRDAAAQVAWAFRSLFNQPEALGLIRGLKELPLVEQDAPYWQRVLAYAIAGGLQSVLDEYAHVLRESLGLLDTTPEVTVQRIGEAMREALGLRTVTLGVDDVRIDTAKGAVIMDSQRMRSHFALRFGDEKREDGQGESRKEQVRQAFNAPFWPFILATTSIGQEGLDFHTYCHAIVHWNLPPNPVDLEQREGRIHRYKGHAVRKNLVEQYGDYFFSLISGDPWEFLFTKAKSRRQRGTLDLIPYWVLPGSAKIERHVPVLPLSRDRERLNTLRRSLTLYRMAFGQNRQEDLLTYLLATFSDAQVAQLIDELCINLEPPHQLRNR